MESGGKSPSYPPFSKGEDSPWRPLSKALPCVYVYVFPQGKPRIKYGAGSSWLPVSLGFGVRTHRNIKPAPECPLIKTFRGPALRPFSSLRAPDSIRGEAISRFLARDCFGTPLARLAMTKCKTPLPYFFKTDMFHSAPSSRGFIFSTSSNSLTASSFLPVFL